MNNVRRKASIEYAIIPSQSNFHVKTLPNNHSMDQQQQQQSKLSDAQQQRKNFKVIITFSIDANKQILHQTNNTTATAWSTFHVKYQFLN